ncbi:uncharacterized protein MONBRDRAFT_5220 [Monosiga brevicollis MX1]|uniref:alpha,alpha-trehalase n=1 Tax=Monosiga brevicollis TaxID=81824 RepID=A9UQA9_MONBE|nr:uncharacterized protein MONBRDRAFT_5220 [Monosiga brevicollis MX1]EDQ93016.1 predicted protein [Monosiga brevicollis MX1]|eukprot:XP_001742778.1 hypothetical protein [Monosiga brevicollis MX1]
MARTLLVLGLLLAPLVVLAMVPVPDNCPNIYGGDALGKPLGQYSGLHTPQRYGIYFTLATPRWLFLNFALTNDGEDKVLAATHDVLLVQRGSEYLALTYASGDLLLGQASSVILRDAVSAPGNCYLSADADNKQYMAYCSNSTTQRFAVTYATLPEEALATAAAGLANADLEGTLSTRLAAMARPPRLNDTGLDRLSRKAYSVMRANTLSPEGRLTTAWSTPDRQPHRAMWLWDSCFHTFGRSLIDPDLAWDFMQALLEVQTSDGRLPIQYNPWDDQTLTLTQPPLAAWAIWDNYQRTNNLDRLRYAAPKLAAYLSYDLTERDINANHLLEWSSPFESGLDQSPVFDSGVQMDSPDFSVFAAIDCYHLGLIYRELNDTSNADLWSQQATLMIEQIHTLLWDNVTQMYHYRNFSGFYMPYTIPTGLLPLMLPNMPVDRVKTLIGYLQDPAVFGTHAPIPTIARGSSDYSTNMWRGPSWININWFVYLGLQRYAKVVPEAQQVADTLLSKTVNMTRDWYASTGALFEFYDADNRVPPTLLERKGNADSGGVRDYHWTAALIYRMLHDPSTSLPQA